MGEEKKLVAFFVRCVTNFRFGDSCLICGCNKL